MATVGTDATTIDRFLNCDYGKWGFSSKVESVSIPKGLSEETIRLISSKRQEPPWMLDFRMDAFHKWQKMAPPSWSELRHPPVDFQDMSYYSEPKPSEHAAIVDAYQRLGVDLGPPPESKPGSKPRSMAVDAVFDSTSVALTHQRELEDGGVFFRSLSQAVREFPEVVRDNLGRVVPASDNFYAALNSAVFSDGSFCYVKAGGGVSIPLSTQFRINAPETGQFERTLIVVEEGGHLTYLEGCTATAHDTNQLHAAVVELYCARNAKIDYYTVQNWYSGDQQGRGGIYNFVTKRGLCDGEKSEISWSQVETGSAITWKYPSVVLRGDGSVGKFHSVALTQNQQQADTGSKMIHLGKNTKSFIVSKGVSAGNSTNCYRGLVQIQPSAAGARNFSQCDSLLIGNKSTASTFPVIQGRNPSSRIEHEASTSKVGDEQLFYFRQRGISEDVAAAMIVSGFCREVVDQFVGEFERELPELLRMKLKGCVG
ncbi:UPF0051 protein in atpA 3'region [Selaginella moellendorffii]|uniref:UPF0051 protein in atpA 3'region n=1 Tax=Selaginella moellendorffii TaxID=88036 RepID=UPI000D1C47AE|nr:UPF0051 protein in atpA 3'region [Selaginella moellendorffii]|eukprot:XP_002982374.2 UPF0051 protein in atpA 3'region [Selaginella moellendorffii]